MTRQLAFLVSHPAFRRTPLQVMARLIAWRVRSALHIPGVARLSLWDLRLSLPPAWRGTAKIIYAFRELYESELSTLDRFLAPGQVFIDVGANYGIYTAVASRMVGDAGQVIAFEPAKDAYRILDRNLAINGLRNVRTLRLALSNRSDRALLRLHPDSSRNVLTWESDVTGPFEEVSTATLDSVLTQYGVDQVHFIKLDVEGAEELVLEGARLLFGRAKPVVLFEVNPDGARGLGLNPDGAWAFLGALGYEFFVAGETHHLVRTATLPLGGNVMAIHRGSSVRQTSASQRDEPHDLWMNPREASFTARSR
jgi:FkbM family methyltransferase